MDIILHIGAHRTGINDFHGYLHQHKAELSAQGVGILYPQRLHGNIQICAQREAQRMGKKLPTEPAARASVQLERMSQQKMRQVIVSDASIAGTLQGNLQQASLYPAIKHRVAHAAKIFEGRIKTIVLCPRSLENFWHSAVATAVATGASVPDKERLDRIALSRRGWRDVISDVARAVPGVSLRVLPFEAFEGRPDTLLERGAGIAPPATFTRPWVDKTPTLPGLRRVLRERGDAAVHLPFGMGHWNPFTNDAHAALRELYADDMMWLTAGADGLATLIEDCRQDRAGKTQPLAVQKEGHPDELEERRMARPC